ncbi:MAG: phosphoribosyltransferase family protein [Clostridiales bacterium]|nr:phosphoribosyltransferase family protein [Clostridiales bacterium]
MMFKDRMDAGLKLADKLLKFKDEDCVIIGIPRGGAIIARCIADKLKKPWDIIVSEKIGAPFNKEIAIGAVCQDGSYILNKNIIKYYGISRDYIDSETKKKVSDAAKRLKDYKGKTYFPDIDGKTVILSDDGIATGYTFTAAINSLKNHGAKRIIGAVPVASTEAINLLKKNIEGIVCAEVSEEFMSVRSFYENFKQNTDEDIINLFKQENIKRFV